MAQIKATIRTELEYAKQSWFDMLSKSGMRKRVYIAALIGFFTQWSGNTLLSYYLSDILGMMGWTTVCVKTRINSVFCQCSKVASLRKKSDSEHQQCPRIAGVSSTGLSLHSSSRDFHDECSCSVLPACY
jgi:hypothetical protein